MTYVRPKPRTKYSGVYALRHKASGAAYIGSSSDMTGRWTHHRFNLRRGLHKTAALQNLWDTAGEDAFEFVVLQNCAVSELLDREQYWLDQTPNRLNWSASAIVRGKTGPSENGSKAAIKRWQNPAYRAKQDT